MMSDGIVTSMVEMTVRIRAKVVTPLFLASPLSIYLAGLFVMVFPPLFLDNLCSSRFKQVNERGHLGIHLLEMFQ